MILSINLRLHLQQARRNKTPVNSNTRIDCSIDTSDNLPRTRSLLQQQRRPCAKPAKSAPQHVGINGNSIRRILQLVETDGSARLELVRPCGKGINLKNCPILPSCRQMRSTDWPRASALVKAYDCPLCNHESYDERRTRIIVKERVGVRMGAGPCRGDPGFEASCGCVVM